MTERRSYVLIGCGGHARTVCDAIAAAGDRVTAYVDPNEAAEWQKLPRIDESKIPPRSSIALGIGGTDPDALKRRLALLDRLLAEGHEAPAVIHPRAIVGVDVEIGSGSEILTGSIVNSGAKIGRGVIVNSGAIVEHDTRVGAGTHVAPGAILLGAVTVGECSMVGAGCVVLPGVTVESSTLVRAATRHPG